MFHLGSRSFILQRTRIATLCTISWLALLTRTHRKRTSQWIGLTSISPERIHCPKFVPNHLLHASPPRSVMPSIRSLEGTQIWHLLLLHLATTSEERREMVQRLLSTRPHSPCLHKHHRYQFTPPLYPPSPEQMKRTGLSVLRLPPSAKPHPLALINSLYLGEGAQRSCPDFLEWDTISYSIHWYMKMESMSKVTSLYHPCRPPRSFPIRK